MGYMCHHAIIVTSWNDSLLAVAHAEAERLAEAAAAEDLIHDWPIVSPIIASAVNDYGTFVIAPDGSKEGWVTSDHGDALRAAFIEWIEAQRYDDGSTSLDYALVQFGDENGDDRLLQSSSKSAAQEV
jgi:hypothetical protein